ncbi:hypothetical protein BDQ17DRAFT_1355476 [Cyathus striatus]|nr:hypothetical protein BDQ17DRAFT_1355476 [Cyathus striatus]
MSPFISELDSAENYIQLRSLKFKHIKYQVYTGTIRAMIPPYRNTLRTLEITNEYDGPLGEHELRELLSVLALKVDLGLLALLSAELSNIESLQLYAGLVVLGRQLELLQVQILRAWKLYDLIWGNGDMDFTTADADLEKSTLNTSLFGLLTYRPLQARVRSWLWP